MGSDPEGAARADHDYYWKTAFDEFLEELLAFLAEDLHAAVDWSRKYETVEASLHPDSSSAATGKLLPDRVYAVHLRSGEPLVLYIHCEFQSQVVADFHERMFLYRMRLFLHLRQPIVSLALLADGDPNFRPNRYDVAHFGERITFEFRAIKLLDFHGSEEQLLATGNVAGLLLAIKLLDLVVRDPGRRLETKVRILRTLARLVRDRGFEPKPAAALTRLLIQGILLPAPLARDFYVEIRRVSEEPNMSFLTIYEQEALERGRVEGRVEGHVLAKRHDVLRVLTARFGPPPTALEATILETADLERLDAWLILAATTPSLDGFVAASSS
jgi:hypothetical protein